MLEMTRFGMGSEDFEHLAQLMADVIVRNKDVRTEVTKMRSGFQKMIYCFDDTAISGLMEELHRLV